MTADICLTACHFTLAGAAWRQPPRWPLKDRLTAAAQAGFGGVGLRPEDVIRQRTVSVNSRGSYAGLGLEVHDWRVYAAGTSRPRRAGKGVALRTSCTGWRRNGGRA